jgi:hypothetical protein
MKKGVYLFFALIIWINFTICSSLSKKKTENLPSELREYKLVKKTDSETGLEKQDVIDDSGEELTDGMEKSRFLFEMLPPRKDELFRVYLTSTEYLIKQFEYKESISRVDDPIGDKFICEELNPFNKANFSDEMSVLLILSPHSGNLTRVSIERVGRIRKVTTIVKDDATRWRFKFPNNIIKPNKFKIYYFIALSGEKNKEEIKKYLKSRVLSY